MTNKLLQKVYSPVFFQEKGYRLVDELTAHLNDKLNEDSDKAIHWNDPEQELLFWKEFLINGNENDLFKTITERTTYVHHPHYIGHQVSPAAPITALTGMISSLLNNGMAVYEMGMSPSAIERVVTDILCEKIGWNSEARGFLTSGGTLANLTALLAARKAISKENIWNEGMSRPLGIMVSEEAHYCVDRAARIMGLGEKGIIKIPCTKSFQMDTLVLEEKYKDATNKGISIFAIVGSAPSTATGIFDDLEAIGNFAENHGLWFHVDGAHGGAGIFSKKYKHTLRGIEKADSVVIDGHKMMMLPTITTALLLKNGIYAHATFSQKADYLLTDSDHEDWYNSGKRTFECTKTMMSIHWYTMLKFYGEEVFEAYVNQLYDMGSAFGEIVNNHTSFALAVTPMANIVCFRFVDSSLSQDQLNELNAKIRQQLLEDGEFYIVQTKLRGWHYLRVTVMNPFTTEEHFQKLLKKIEGIAKKLISP
ncbi:aminotransferase class I/II-fold pyridoxal phosphate-dependent enzyme [Maribacter litopenaei]|uniref:Aminotransferase class I/II-fold pyridoxal phosphate-dependent enzyme n=1 Tax=Maribacter litopenaei TaxID=2976127 RepID=A0ABY5Y3W4_9FLAO|nr:aminotransferase class I/II-fold pyridoxal phosphate-dependent enzyme [Maribacter litopenaei]UWX53707.1 aminotransferase class I/II-fold pyridoxal phosphate-dependent enzyme [Maribacter litopenaei]